MGQGAMLKRQVRRACDMKNFLVLNFLCLLINLFFLVMQINQGFWPVETFFQPVLTRTDKANMFKTLQTFVKACDANNLTYLMYGGTLIGSYRHHGPIPWDDDVDILMNGSQKHRVKEVLSSFKPHYDVYTYGEDMDKNTQWKFFLNSKDSKTFVHKPFSWPYIDIFFFNENRTHIWDTLNMDYSYSKKRVFPLEKRPFAHLMLDAPCDPKNIISRNYQLELCRSRSFSHMMEFPMFSFKQKDVPCKRLENTFPFVFRSYIDGVVNETLAIGDYTIQSHVLPAYCKGQHP